MEIIDLTIKKAHEGLIKKEFSALDLTHHFLDKIEKLDKKLNSFLTMTRRFSSFSGKKN